MITNGLPANLPGTLTNGTAPFGFAMFNLTGGSGPDTLYVNEGTISFPREGTGAILKYSLVGGAWVNNRALGCANAFGLAGGLKGKGKQTNITLFIAHSWTARGPLAVHLQG